MPPATTTPTAPASNWSWPSITVFMPEPHILVSVVAGTLSGRPAAIRAWRAGAWPMPAIRQQPISTSSTSLACTGVSSIAARMAAAPSRGADRPWNWPWKAPIAVRRAARMTTGSSMFNSLAARGFNGSLGCHADGAIEPDHLAVGELHGVSSSCGVCWAGCLTHLAPWGGACPAGKPETACAVSAPPRVGCVTQDMPWGKVGSAWLVV